MGQPRPARWPPLYVKLMEFAISKPKLAKKLVAEYPEVLTLRNSIGETALHYLAVENYAEAVQLLIDLGASARVGNDFGRSALAEAIQTGATDTVAVLREAGAVL